MIMRISRNKRIRRIIAAVLSAVCLFMSGTQAFATTKSQLNKQKENAEKQLENANEAVSEISSERSEAVAEVEEADHQLVQLLATIDILDDEIAAKKVDVQVAGEEYDKASAEEHKQYKTMKERIRFMYEKGDARYIDIIMQSTGFADAVNKADYVEKIYDYDRELLDRYADAAREADETHERLVSEEAELEGMQLEFKEQQAELEATIVEKKAVVENFDEQLARARSEAKKYENQIKEANTEIARIAAKEKAEREAREKAEREAREKAEKEAKEKQKKASSSAAGKTEDQSGEQAKDQGKDPNGEESQEGEYKEEKKKSSSAASEYDESSQEGEYKKETSSSAAQTSKPAVSGSGTGADIASFACQFIGNPYVSGGTSLTDGADCSGFTFSVYKHFGYSIPRTSSEQLSCGTGVDYSEAKAGDLVCYAGHVGIYIGNGMIVHASSPATGIKTTIATYRPILSVRRVVK